VGELPGLKDCINGSPFLRNFGNNLTSQDSIFNGMRKAYLEAYYESRISLNAIENALDLIPAVENALDLIPAVENALDLIPAVDNTLDLIPSDDVSPLGPPPPPDFETTALYLFEDHLIDTNDVVGDFENIAETAVTVENSGSTKKWIKKERDTLVMMANNSTSLKEFLRKVDSSEFAGLVLFFAHCLGILISQS
jgi:hypothetical protein